MRKTAVLLTSIAILTIVSGCRKIPTPRFTAPTDRDEAWQQDIEYLLDSFPKYCKSLTEESEAEFEGILNRIHSSVPSLSNNEIIVGIMRAVAVARDGHTRVNMKPSAQKLRRLPVRFYWFSDGLYVIKAAPQYADMLGDKVLEINGHKSEELVVHMGDIISGNETSIRYSSSYFLASPDFLNGMGVLADPDSVPLTLAREDGSVHTLSLPTLPLGEKILGYERSKVQYGWQPAVDHRHCQGHPCVAHRLGKDLHRCWRSYLFGGYCNRRPLKALRGGSGNDSGRAGSRGIEILGGGEKVHPSQF